VAIGVVIEPLVAWLWAGGLLIGVGGVLALVPGSRRRSTEPASAPSLFVAGHEGGEPDGRAGHGGAPAGRPEPAEPVGALVARGSA
jgi:hypothetical protein